MTKSKLNTKKKDNAARKVIILGGGLAGLVAADKLLDSKFSVNIIEHAPFLGGLASSFIMENEEIPKFNHHIVKHNTKTLEYLKRYNLLKDNVWKRIRVAIAIDKKIYRVNNPIHLLRFKELSFYGKVRFALFGVYSVFLMNPEKIPEKMNLEEWLHKVAGEEVTEKIWKQLYGRNKFNISLKRISAKQFAHRLYEKEGFDYFTFPKKGIQKMIDGLETDVVNRKGKITHPAKILHIDIKKKIIKYNFQGKEVVENFDILINTIPVPELIKICSGLPRFYVAAIKKLRYVPVVGLAFGTEEFLDKDNYWINIFNERVHVIYQHSLLIDKYKSKVAWCIRYGGSEEDLVLSDEVIKREYLACLIKFFPKMKIKWCKVFRDKYAEPIYDKDYSRYGPQYTTPFPYFFNAGIQVTFPKIRNMNVALESGEIVVDKIIQKFESSGNE